MTTASAIEYIAPLEKKHKQYLCILVIYSHYNMSQIVKLLQRRFRHDRSITQHHRRFDEELTQQYWEHMERKNQEILQWARAQGPDSWRVKRVLRWAEEQDV